MKLICLENYINMLYKNDIISKIRGTELILKLARNPTNLKVLYENESVLNCIFLIVAKIYFCV